MIIWVIGIQADRHTHIHNQSAFELNIILAKKTRHRHRSMSRQTHHINIYIQNSYFIYRHTVLAHIYNKILGLVRFSVIIINTIYICTTKKKKTDTNTDK